LTQDEASHRPTELDGTDRARRFVVSNAGRRGNAELREAVVAPAQGGAIHAERTGLHPARENALRAAAEVDGGRNDGRLVITQVLRVVGWPMTKSSWFRASARSPARTGTGATPVGV